MKRNKHAFFSADGERSKKSSITGVPAEVIESVAPIRMHKRELLTDTGGAGKFRGGLGQEMILEVLTGKPAIHSCIYDPTKFPADGYHGGLPGSVGAVVLSNGGHPHPKSRYVIHPRQTVTLRLPGGAGFYSPSSEILVACWRM